MLKQAEQVEKKTVDLQQLQQTYLEHLLGVGIALQQAQQLIEGLTLQQLQLICQNLGSYSPYPE